MKLLEKIVVLGILIMLGLLLFTFYQEEDIQSNIAVENSGALINPQEPSSTPSIQYKNPPSAYEIPSSGYVSQTFNNCGPAALSMIMSYFGKNVSQDVLRDQMRPFNNPEGGIDDKSIFASEFVNYAQSYGFDAISRPNGDTELVKLLIANDIPVVLRTWLHPGEDIGHFRIVRGYDDASSVFIQDDSYEGKGLRYDYAVFEQMWQPFNYGYILVFPQEKKPLVQAILGEEWDEMTAYSNALKRAENEEGAYAGFNRSTAYFHLNQYQKSAEEFEKVQADLPSRMLWYQTEPLQAYIELKQFDRVLTMSSQILNSGNPAFSEMYFMRGQVYAARGERELARTEYENALYYNKNFDKARDALNQI